MTDPPGAPGGPDSPDSPGVPAALGRPGGPGTPGGPDATGKPDSPGPPAGPGAPGEPGGPGNPGGPGQTGGPGGGGRAAGPGRATARDARDPGGRSAAAAGPCGPSAGGGAGAVAAAPTRAAPAGSGPAGTAGEALSRYLHGQAAEFLRGLRLHRESGADADEAVEAALRMRRCARRIAGALHTFRALTDTDWADPLRAELTWLSGVLAREHAYAARLERLRCALHRLSGGDVPGGAAGTAGVADPAGTASTDRTASPAGRGSAEPELVPSGARGTGAQEARGEAAAREARPSPGHRAGSDGGQRGPAGVGAQRRGEPGRSTSGKGALTVGAARAGALLERQLTLARTRAHSAALQALGSSRFHAVADAVALLASDVPLAPGAAGRPAAEALPPLVDQAHRRLVEAVDALPLGRAGRPYNAEGLVHGLAATGAPDAPPAAEHQDGPWHHVRLLVRLRRYAQEVLDRAAVREGVAHSRAHAGALDGASLGSCAPGHGYTGEPPRTPGQVQPPTPAAHAADEPTAIAVRLYGAAQALERHRDAAEAAAAAATAARTPRIAPATAYALGVLHADQRHDVEAARYAFGRLWPRLAASTP